MDLTHDWKTLNEVLFCQSSLAKHRPTMVALEEGQGILDAVLSSGEPFAERQIPKENLAETSLKYRVEQTVTVSKRELDQIAADAAALGTNYFQQLEHVRSRVFKHVNRPGEIRISRDHFILKFFSGRIATLLPRRFNVLVFLDQRPSFSTTLLAFEYRAILLSFDRGKLDQFFEPDFSSLHQERLPDWRTDPLAIGKYLETRYMLPCFGLFLLQNDWDQCVSASDPWSFFVRTFDEGRSALYPNSGIFKAFLAAQRVKSYFSRG